jgi:hypothetical protein
VLLYFCHGLQARSWIAKALEIDRGIAKNSDGRSYHLVYYVFDVMVVSGVNVMRGPLMQRRQILESKIAPTLVEPVRLAPEFDADFLTSIVKTNTASKGLSRKVATVDMSRV